MVQNNTTQKAFLTASVTQIRITVHVEKSVSKYRRIAVCIQRKTKPPHLTHSVPLVSILVTSFKHIICGTQIALSFSELLQSSLSDQSYHASMEDIEPFWHLQC